MISAILLAAGSSRRMNGANKLLLPFHDQAMVRHVAGQILASPVEEVVVVLGHEGERVQAALDGLPLRFALNENHRLGLTSSIQAGVAALSAECRAFLVCPGDMPLLGSAHYAELIRFFEEKKKIAPAPIVRPTDGDRHGHPVMFDMIYAPDIAACADADGCREVMRQYPACLFRYTSVDDAFFHDIDSREDYIIRAKRVFLPS
jgi:molybdenum cofactor cytidylyltransferase